MPLARRASPAQLSTVTSHLERLAAAVDGYTILRELGADGRATVSLANDLEHDRKVALEVLKPGDRAVQPILVEHWLTELAAMGARR